MGKGYFLSHTQIPPYFRQWTTSLSDHKSIDFRHGREFDELAVIIPGRNTIKQQQQKIRDSVKIIKTSLK
jgi:hypothetical protein